MVAPGAGSGLGGRSGIARRTLVAPTFETGHEVLSALARTGRGWVGYRVETPRSLAGRLASRELRRGGWRTLEPLEGPELLDRSLETACEAHPELAWLGRGYGFRIQVHSAIDELRLAGVGVGEFGKLAAREGGGRLAFVAATLGEYVGWLGRKKIADAADEALLALELVRRWQGAHAAGLPGEQRWPVEFAADEVLVLSGVPAWGRQGELLRAILEAGAELLPQPRVEGLGVPESLLWRSFERPGLLSFTWAPGGLREWLQGEGAEIGGAEGGASGGAEVEARRGSAGRESNGRSAASVGTGRKAGGTVRKAGRKTDGPAARPQLAFFRAASVTDELRSVMRRVLAAGWRWDEVEIVAPDTSVYGSALHALASRLSIPVTYADGLDASRTRVGRAARAYLEWIEGGYHAGVIHRLLEAGDIRPNRPEGGLAPAEAAPVASDLARRFRQLRIGWGRTRYLSQLEVALAELREETRPPDDGDGDGGDGADDMERLRRRLELEAIGGLLRQLLASAPDPGEETSASELAAAVLKFLDHVPERRGLEADVRREIQEELEQVKARLKRRTSLAGARAIVERACDVKVRGARRPEEGTATPPAGTPGLLDETRGGVPAGSGALPDEAEAGPARSAGGYLHLSSLRTGGFTGRKAVFLVGFDATAVPGRPRPEGLVLDREKAALGGRGFAGPRFLHGAEDNTTYDTAALLARLSGCDSLTVSFVAWDALEFRAREPSGAVLRLLRVDQGDATMGFDALEAELGPLVSPLPERASSASGVGSGGSAIALDSDDVWLRAIAAGDELSRGADRVRRAFPRLRRGEAHWRRRAGAPGPAQGVIGELKRLAELLPPKRGVSATTLETLGACPLRFLHSTVLGVRPPDDPEYDRLRWLDAVTRGSILHGIYARTLAKARKTETVLGSPALDDMALSELDRALETARRTVPSPGDGAIEREYRALRGDVRSFLRLLRRDPPYWIEVELGFGRSSESDPPAVTIDFNYLQLNVNGAIDRIDNVPGGLRVIDYKTGTPPSPSWAGGDDLHFRKGRQLQHAIYARVAEQLFKEPVVDAGYVFPTTRGENDVSLTDRKILRRLDDVLPGMIRAVEKGNFVPTDEARDCGFCDYKTVCRARTGDWGREISPLAAWSKSKRSEDHEAFSGLRAAREGAGRP